MTVFKLIYFDLNFSDEKVMLNFIKNLIFYKLF